MRRTSYGQTFEGRESGSEQFYYGIMQEQRLGSLVEVYEPRVQFIWLWSGWFVKVKFVVMIFWILLHRHFLLDITHIPSVIDGEF